MIQFVRIEIIRELLYIFNNMNDSIGCQLITSHDDRISSGQRTVQVTLEWEPVAIQSAAAVATEPVATEPSTAQMLCNKIKEFNQ